jgi:DNA-binding transcriptional LysR family regulator
MDLDDIAVFVKVVQAGSFSQAARLLGMPNTTVSAKVARLEKRLGVTLIQRTTRKLHITPAGRAYFERCVRGLSEIETAEAEITLATAEPRGALRLTATAEVAHSVLPPVVTRYARAYPRMSVELIVTNRIVDLIAEGIDLALRAAELKDSTLVARRFMAVDWGLWVSQSYAASREVPRSVSELAGHATVVFSRLPSPKLKLADGEDLELALDGPIVADDLETVRAFVLEGEGIGALPEFLAREDAAHARLVRVLPELSWSAGALSFVYPSQQFVPAKVRAFIDLALEPGSDSTTTM